MGAHIVVKEAHKHTPDTVEHIFRQVFWARYVDWALTTPLLLLDLAFLAGMNGANITVTIVADLIMVLLGLFAAFGRTDGQKWGYYTIACFDWWLHSHPLDLVPSCLGYWRWCPQVERRCRRRRRRRLRVRRRRRHSRPGPMARQRRRLRSCS